VKTWQLSPVPSYNLNYSHRQPFFGSPSLLVLDRANPGLESRLPDASQVGRFHTNPDLTPPRCPIHPLPGFGVSEKTFLGCIDSVSHVQQKTQSSISSPAQNQTDFVALRLQIPITQELEWSTGVGWAFCTMVLVETRVGLVLAGSELTGISDQLLLQIRRDTWYSVDQL